jgi:hypothetical protein
MKLEGLEDWRLGDYRVLRLGSCDVGKLKSSEILRDTMANGF